MRTLAATVTTVALTATALAATAVPANAGSRGIPTPPRGICHLLTPFNPHIRVMSCTTAPRLRIDVNKQGVWVRVYPR
jgi:hypothetical protein